MAASRESADVNTRNSFSTGQVTGNTKGDTIVETTNDQENVVRTNKLRDDPEARAAFLATFSQEEAKAIMRKVDIRFFVLIGLMFMVKNVC